MLRHQMKHFSSTCTRHSNFNRMTIWLKPSITVRQNVTKWLIVKLRQRRTNNIRQSQSTPEKHSQCGKSVQKQSEKSSMSTHWSQVKSIVHNKQTTKPSLPNAAHFQKLNISNLYTNATNTERWRWSYDLHGTGNERSSQMKLVICYLKQVTGRRHSVL